MGGVASARRISAQIVGARAAHASPAGDNGGKEG